MTKIVAELPAKNDPSSPKGNAAVSDTEPRTVFVDKKKAYLMEVVLRKTDSFNLYNNPAAFGIPTATGSSHWDGTSGNTRPTTGSSNPSDGYGTVPSW